MRRVLSVAALVLGFAVVFAPGMAMADWDHGHGWDHRSHYREGFMFGAGSHSGISFSFFSGGDYHRPHYRPHPVVIERTVVVERPTRVVYTAPYESYEGPVGATQTSPTYRNRDGRYCREFQTSVRVGGRSQPSYGTACRQPDGDWQVVE